MNGSGRVRRLRFFLCLAPVVLAAMAVPASASEAAEQKVSENTVAEGLKTIERAGAEIAEYAGEDKAKAQTYVTTIKPVWAMIEGTVRANDNDSYVALESAIEGLEAVANDNDGKRAEGALKAFTAAANTYSTKATAAPATPAPAAGDRTAAAATPAPAAAPAPDAAPAAAEAGDATLARTGPMSDALAVLAGAALALGGVSLIGGARRRTSPIV